MPRFTVFHVLVTVTLMVLAAACTQARAENGGSEGDSALRTLAERLLATQLLGPAGPEQVTVELLPEQLPPDLPIDLELQPETGIVGSAVRRGEAGLLSAEIVLDAPADPQETLEYYQTALGEQGLEVARSGSPAGGFQGSMSSQTRSFCAEDGSLWLILSANDAGEFTDLRIRLQDGAGPCGQEQGPPPPRELNQPGLPELQPPPGVNVRPSGGGSGPGRRFTEAVADTDEPLDELKRHYRAQLEAAGWELTASGGGEGFLWSTWQLPDEEWSGLFWLLRVPAGHITLHLRIESDSAAGGETSSGWASAPAQPAPTATPAPPPATPPTVPPK